MLYFLILLLIVGINSQYPELGFLDEDIDPAKCEQAYNKEIKKFSNIPYEDYVEYWNLPPDMICEKIYYKIHDINFVWEEIDPHECKKYYNLHIEPQLKISYEDYMDYLDLPLYKSCKIIFNYKF